MLSVTYVTEDQRQKRERAQLGRVTRVKETRSLTSKSQIPALKVMRGVIDMVVFSIKVRSCFKSSFNLDTSVQGVF